MFYIDFLYIIHQACPQLDLAGRLGKRNDIADA